MSNAILESMDHGTKAAFHHAADLLHDVRANLAGVIFQGEPGLRKVSSPAMPHPGFAEGDVVPVVTVSVGVCGSDEEKRRSGQVKPPPGYNFLRLGHEWAGLLVRPSNGYPAGTPVVGAVRLPCVPPHPGCDGDVCRNPTDYKSVGSTRCHGAMARVVQMPTWGLVALPLHGSDLDRTVLRYGFYVEALAVARSGIDKARGEAVQPRRAAVVGVGGIGLPALFWLTQWEGTEVFAFDRKPSDSAVAAAAKQFGVTYVRSGDMGALSGSFDYVVEAAGNPQALRLSLELLGPQGRLTYLSLPPEASSVEIPGDLLKQATLNGLRIDFSVGFGMAHLRAAAEALPRFCAALGPNLLERLTYPIAFSELSDEAIETAQRQTGGAKLYIRMQE